MCGRRVEPRRETWSARQLVVTCCSSLFIMIRNDWAMVWCGQVGSYRRGVVWDLFWVTDISNRTLEI
eukprot:g61790.t1